MKKNLFKKESFVEKIRAVMVLAAQSFFLAGVAIFSVMPTGCKLEDDGTDVMSGDHKAPVIENVTVLDENTVEIEFSESVKVETGAVTEIGTVGEDEVSVKEESSVKDDGAEDVSKTEKNESGEKDIAENVDSENAGIVDKAATDDTEGNVVIPGNSSEVVVDIADDNATEKEDEFIADNDSNRDSEVGSAVESETNGEPEIEKKPEISYEDDGSKVIITLPEETVPGHDYVISGTVEDEKGNTLTFSIPFVGYNGSLPKVVMTEIQTESVSQNTTEKKNGTYRNEFVEFLALSDGNLAGFELISAYDGEDCKFVFPSVDVKAGEVFVVHLRNRGEGCISETGDDLNLAFGGYAKDGIRDLWSESEATALGNNTDVIFLRNAADGSIWDGVIYRDSKVTEWSEKFTANVENLVQIGFYSDANVESASLTEGLTMSKTLSRKNAYNLMQDVIAGNEIAYPLAVAADDWIVSSATCGEIKEN